MRNFSLSLVLLMASTANAGHIVSFPEGIDGGSGPERRTIKECLTDLEELIDWPEDQTLRAAESLCSLREEHFRMKTELLKDLQEFVDEYEGETNHSRDQSAIGIAEHIAKTDAPECIKTHQRAYVCHNVACAYQSEVIRMDCYEWLRRHPSITKDLSSSRLGNP